MRRRYRSLHLVAWQVEPVSEADMQMTVGTIADELTVLYHARRRQFAASRSVSGGTCRQATLGWQQTLRMGSGWAASKAVRGSTKSTPRNSATGSLVTCAADGVDAERERRVARAAAPAGAVHGDLEDVGERGVGQRVGARVRHRARHVADGVVDHAVQLVHRVVVRRLADRLDAAALVDGDVDDHRAAASSPRPCPR